MRIRAIILTLAVALLIVVPAFNNVHSISDPLYGDVQRLWTTNATANHEIDVFNAGDPIYLMSNPNEYRPIDPGNYTIYVIAGNVATSPVAPWENKKIPDDLGPLVTPPINVTADTNGHFGRVLIWASSTPNNYTVILDRTAGWDPQYGYYSVPGIGHWNDYNDYRDDLCTRVPTDPSFFVVPDVPLGTLTATLSLFAGLGLFAMRKRRLHNGT